MHRLRRIQVTAAIFLACISTAQADEPYRGIIDSERTSRLAGSFLGMAVGTTLILGGALTSGDRNTRAVMTLGGATTAAFSLKGFFVPTPVEELATRYSKAPDSFQPELFAYFRDTARRNRLWDGTASLLAGGLIIGSGAYATGGSFTQKFAYVSGAMMALGGISRLLFESPTERIVDRYEARKRFGPAVETSATPTFFVDASGRAVSPGLAFSLSW